MIDPDDDPDAGMTAGPALAPPVKASEGGRRPLTVTAGALFTYILAAACLARGAADPSAGDGTGASGIGLIVLGTMELGLATLSLPGRWTARACLAAVLMLGGVIIVIDQTQPVWFRIIAIALALATVILMFLVKPSRRYFGDDDTLLVIP